MDEFYRMSYLKGLLLIICGILIALICSLIVLPLQLNSNSSAYIKNFHNRVISNEKTINTLELFTQSAILYQIK